MSHLFRKKQNLYELETIVIKTLGNEKPCDIVQFAVACADNLKVYVKAYEIDLPVKSDVKFAVR